MKPETPPTLDTSFRSALARMNAAGRIRAFSREADPDCEIASIMKLFDNEDAAIVFGDVKGFEAVSIG